MHSVDEIMSSSVNRSLTTRLEILRLAINLLDSILCSAVERSLPLFRLVIMASPLNTQFSKREGYCL